MASVATSLPVIQPDELAACCSPMTSGVVSDETAQTLARMFKALGDPTRVKLLSLIAAAPEGEACICDMTDPVGLSQPTVSHHMKLLVESGLATREQRGKWAYYRVAPEMLRSLAMALEPVPRI
jgi:ArsR family transcriptional regulator, arsenate/arsenite/antimonite-responsive transcriptional repressor